MFDPKGQIKASHIVSVSGPYNRIAVYIEEMKSEGLDDNRQRSASAVPWQKAASDPEGVSRQHHPAKELPNLKEIEKGKNRKKRNPFSSPPNNENGNFRLLMYNAVSDAAQYGGGQGAPAMGTHDNKIGLGLLGRFHNFLNRVPFDKNRIEFNAIFLKNFFYTSDKTFGRLFEIVFNRFDYMSGRLSGRDGLTDYGVLINDT